MTFALKELARLLVPDQTLVGSVAGIEGAMIRVATAQGAVVARTLDALAIGDRVLVKNGLATRAPVARQAFPV